jgi:hypothetical protein
VKTVREASRFGSDGGPSSLTCGSPGRLILSFDVDAWLRRTAHQSDWWSRLDTRANDIDR